MPEHACLLCGRSPVLFTESARDRWLMKVGFDAGYNLLVLPRARARLGLRMKVKRRSPSA